MINTGEIGGLLGLGIRTMSDRKGASLVILLSTAVAVAVLCAILIFTQGLLHAVGSTGSSGSVIVLSRGAGTELVSSLPRASINLLKDAPGIIHTAQGAPMVSADTLVLVSMPTKESSSKANVTVRGVDADAFLQMTKIKIVQGRQFEPGKHEIIVGKMIQGLFAGLQLNDKQRLGDADWTVVGVFESDKDAHESEVITDTDGLRAAYRRPNYQSATVQLQNASSFAEFVQFVEQNPKLNVDAIPETEYYESLSRPIAKLASTLAFGIGGVMAIGAVFAALNSMFIVVDRRAAEFATLRALGFSKSALITAITLEALLISLFGGVIGVCIISVLFGGQVTSTTGNGLANSLQMASSMKLTISALGYCACCAASIGLVGGFIPAAVAANRHVIAALRDK